MGNEIFSINEHGHVAVTPREGHASVDLKEIMDQLLVKDITAPVFLRFPDILDNRIEKITGCFRQAANEYDYKGQSYTIYPIKVNQMRPVVEEIVSYGKRFDIGLEAGSKARTACGTGHQHSRERTHNMQRIQGPKIH